MFVIGLCGFTSFRLVESGIIPEGDEVRFVENITSLLGRYRELE